MTPDDIAARTEGLAARRDLLRHGFTPAAIRWWSRDLRSPFPGVFLTGSGPITERQRLLAATMTAPDTSLAHASAAAHFGFVPTPPRTVIVVRHGDGGPEWFGDLCVTRSLALEGHLTTHEGIPTTTVERTIIDLWPTRRGAHQEKLVREAVRLRLTTPERVLRATFGVRGKKGTPRLRAFLVSISALPYDRCKSDAEIYGLTLLHGAGVEIPRVNEIFAGGEADFCWPHLMLIIEIDGPANHILTDRDQRKQAAWEAAGFTVLRLPTPILYADPGSLLVLAPAPTVGKVLP